MPRAAEYAAAANDLATFEGDDIETLELGIKATILDGRVDLTLNVYGHGHRQRRRHPPQSTFPRWSTPTTRTGSSRITTPSPITSEGGESRGLEFEGRGQLTDAISLHFGGAWVPDAETLNQEAGAPNRRWRAERQHRSGQPYRADARPELLRLVDV